MKKWQQNEFRKLLKLKKNGDALELIKVTRMKLQPGDLAQPEAVLNFLIKGFVREVISLRALTVQLLNTETLAEWKDYLKTEKEKNGIPK